MITLDQVQKLEKKVNDAVDLINRFKAEKVVLEEKIDKYEFRILELEEIAEQLNKDQTEIEDKIIGALNQLEDLESIETIVEIEVNSAETENEILPEEEISVESSVSEEEDIVETEEEESDDSVDKSKKTEEISNIDEDESAPQDEVEEEVIEDDVESDATLSESEEDDQSELQESITENSQDGLPSDETVEEEIIPTVNSEFGEMPEDKTAEPDKSGSDLFEQSLDIF